MANRPSIVLFLIGCFAIPFFNDSAWFLYISEIFRSPSNFILLFSLAFFGVEQSISPTRFYVRRNDLYFVLGLSILIVFSALFNLHLSGPIQGTGITGFQKILFSSANMIVLLLFLLFYCHILNSFGIERLVKYLRFGFLLTLAYVIFEIINYVIPIKLSGGGDPGNYIADSIDSFIHVRDRAPGMPRARGFAFEPSYLVAVLVFLLPFLVADRSRYRKYTLCGWLICVWATGSPTGIVALLIFLVFYNFSFIFSILLCAFFSVLCFILVLGIFEGYIEVPIEDMESTATRVGSWIASFEVIKENPIFGVGPGMQGYWLIHHYPDFFWTTRESEVWVNLGLESFDAPTFSTILTITLSIGLAPILYVLTYLIKTKRIKEIMVSPLARASAAAMFVVSFGLNGYIFLGYWIFFAMTLSSKWSELEQIRNKCKVPLRKSVKSSEKQSASSG